MRHDNRRLAYLNSHYPAVSHTFIHREINALRAQGFEVHTFSIRGCDPADLKTAAMREENANTTVLLGGDVSLWLTSHLSLLRRHPFAWIKGIARALRSGDQNLKAKVWQLFYFGEAVVLHHEMDRRGLRHVHVHHANVGADVARLATTIGRSIDGNRSWIWTLTVHGSREFEISQQWDVPAKLADATAVSCISDFCRAQLMRHMARGGWDKLSIVRMSVDPEHFLPPSGGRDHDGPLRVLSVGRLVDLKGLPMLLEALADLHHRGRRVQARIVGQGPTEADLRRQCQELAIEQVVTFTGAVGEDAIVEHFQWADVYVSASFLEGLPVVIMEAMSTALPVISTQVGAVSELITEGVSGLIIPPSTADAIYAALIRLYEDPGLRQRMGSAAREAVLAAYTPRTTGPAIAKFISEARQNLAD